MYKVLLWGCSLRTTDILRYSWLKDCEILGIIDKNNKIASFEGYRVLPISRIKEYSENVDYIILSNQHFGEIINYCINEMVDWEKLVITENVIEPLLEDRYAPMEYLAPELYEKQKNQRWRLIKLAEIDNDDQNDFLSLPEYSSDIYRQDYFRFRTFELCANMIKKNNINGAVAELGVFQGDFSSLINRTFPERKCFLFDSFEGFIKEEAENGVKSGRITNEFAKSFTSTSEQEVLRRMHYPELVRIFKGFFPSTVTDELRNQKFSFVSIDVDLEESTYEGLKFFYPRLNEGGYIFIHDYQSIIGVDNAVNRYEKDYGKKLNIVPLADRSGTVVITK